jgi:putative spermidine/putrescine transport system substrate-binding protein
VSRRTFPAALAAAVGVLSLVVAGCDAGESDDEATTPAPNGMLRVLGEGEGRVDLVAWAGYVEDGSSDPAVDWVTSFEQRTGCRVHVRFANNADELVALLRTGDYDGGSVSGDVTLELIAAGDVAPVNTDLIPNYADVYDSLKNLPHNSVDGQTYGVPQGRAANLLMWRTDVVVPAPDSWSAVWDDQTPYRGRIAAYDSPMYIADAALYLKATRPELGIDDVYELDDRQFRAAVDLLTSQHEIVGEYWSDFVTEQAAFAAGNWVLGTTWQLVADLLLADGVPVDTVLPKEGSTGWSDTWMVSSAAKHPNCMFRWLDHVVSPGVNARVAEWFGQAPSNRKACALTADRTHCRRYHADDEEFFSRIAYWKTPRRDCGDTRGAVCKDYSDWVDAWSEIED